jgi:uncharacterized protein
MPGVDRPGSSARCAESAAGICIRSIPNLGRFQFLAAGKAIKAERPILLGRPFDQAKKDASDALRQQPPETPDVA